MLLMLLAAWLDGLRLISDVFAAVLGCSLYEP